MRQHSSLPLNAANPLRVVIAIDVEEEGLFSGAYPSHGLTVNNVRFLRQLAAVSGDLGYPLTLLCTHPVLADADALETLRFMQSSLGAEIGAHLHHWNTPPISSNDARSSVSARNVPKDDMETKLRNLLALAEELRGTAVTSFRMGRWDLRASLWPILARAGISVDSSVHPMRFPKDGPDHFMAPLHPFKVESQGREILEMPICVVPVLPGLRKPVHLLARRLGDGPGRGLRRSVPHWGFMPFKPVWHGLRYLQLAARLFVAQGGRVLSLTWHSSEMMAGACPHMPTQAHVDQLLRRIQLFLQWLAEAYPVKGITMGQLPSEDMHFPRLRSVAASEAGNWCPEDLVTPVS